MTAATGRGPRLAIVILSMAMLGLVVIPCAALLLQSVTPPGPGGEPSLSLEYYDAILRSVVVRQAILRTLLVSVATTLLCILAAYPLAFAVAYGGRRTRPVLIAIIIFPFMLSAVVRAHGWTIVIGENGLLNQLLLAVGLIERPLRLMHSEIAIIIGETHLLCPYLVLAILTAVRRIDPNIEAAAKSLGASPPVVFFRVLVPLTLPGLLAGTLLVFAFAMTAFATPYLLGGTRAPLIATLLYRYAFTNFDLPRAFAVAGLLLVFGVSLLALHRVISRRALAKQGHVT